MRRNVGLVSRAMRSSGMAQLGLRGLGSYVEVPLGRDFLEAWQIMKTLVSRVLFESLKGSDFLRMTL